MLRISGLSAGYAGSRVLHAVDLEVPSRGVVCVMGRNGVGKTTLLKCVMGLLPAWSGRIEIDGRDVTRLRADERARGGVGYVPQGREIFASLTVAENLMIGLKARGVRGGIPDEVFALFPALKALLPRRGGDLSGGQQQQLAFARALVTEPTLLLLDEPTEGIQPSVIDQIEDVIIQLKERGRTAIVLVEQYVEFAARLADSYVMMEKGRIVAGGAVNELNDDVVKRHLVV